MKAPKVKKTRLIGLRLSPKEYEKIEQEYRKSTCPNLSEYVRHRLLNKPITVRQRNQSLDDWMEEMIRLRRELNGIGNNFNQAVKKLYSLQQIAEFQTWLLTWEWDRKIMLNKVDEIKKRIDKMADSWLQ